MDKKGKQKTPLQQRAEYIKRLRRKQHGGLTVTDSKTTGYTVINQNGDRLRFGVRRGPNNRAEIVPRNQLAKASRGRSVRGFIKGSTSARRAARQPSRVRAKLAAIRQDKGVNSSKAKTQTKSNGISRGISR